MPKVIWEVDSTHPEKAESIREALREVVDPELGLNVIELGMIRDVSFNDTDLHLRMILTTPFCPYGPALLESVRAKSAQIIGLPTTIELGMEMWDPSMMEDDASADWGLF
jgi:metal-sulfur cluster biosynthetic enzyme